MALWKLAPHNTNMLDTQSIKVQGLKGLSRTELDAMIAQLLSHIDEQERHIGEQGKRLDSAQQAIKWRDAKIEKITFELARLKAWKFGAKSERMTAEQRELFAEALAADQASLEAQLAALQEAGEGRGLDPRARCTSPEAPAQARAAARSSATRGSTRRAREHDLRMRPGDAARGRGRQRAAGHHSGAVLRAAPDPGQVGLQVLPAHGPGAGRPAGLRQRPANARACRPTP